MAHYQLTKVMRRRQQRVAAFVVISILLVMTVGLLTSCGPRAVEVDPRDAEAVESFRERCDRSSSTVTLKVVNHNSASITITLLSNSGMNRRLRSVNGLSTERREVSRFYFGQGGQAVLHISGGGMSRGDFAVWLTPLMCGVGTLSIEPLLSASMFAGADL